jgi:hypothetical protein
MFEEPKRFHVQSSLLCSILTVLELCHKMPAMCQLTRDSAASKGGHAESEQDIVGYTNVRGQFGRHTWKEQHHCGTDAGWASTES